MRNHVVVLLWSIAGCVMLAGCGGGQSHLPVSGKVTHGGAAFTKKGTITFYPDKAKGNESTATGTGDLNEQGDFKIMSSGKDGIPAGWYKVTVNSQSPSNPKEPYSTPKYNLDKKYASVDTTPLEVEVKSGAGADAYVINIP
jgi:hypothetical protein